MTTRDREGAALAVPQHAMEFSMPSSVQDQTAAAVQQQIEAMCAGKPAFEPVFKSFGGLLAAIAASRTALPTPDLSGFVLDKELLEQGTPILEHPNYPSVDFHLRQTAAMLLPALKQAFPALRENIETLAELSRSEQFARDCQALLISGDADLLRRLAEESGLSPEILAFALDCLARPVLELQAAALAPVLQEVSWTLWNKGRCPVCGGSPSMSLLQPGPEEPNEFLKNVSAQRWLCCSSCAHAWRLARTICPFCEHDEKKDREYFHVEDQMQERVETCKHCNHYLLTIDVRDRVAPVDHRVAPLGLIHLDLLARERGYLPLADTPWNLAAPAVAEAQDGGQIC